MKNLNEPQWQASITTIEGVPTAVIGPVIPENAPERIREGMARRNVVNAGGRRPCGATMPMPNRAERRVARKTRTPMRVVVQHESGCPAPMLEGGWIR